MYGTHCRKKDAGYTGVRTESMGKAVYPSLEFLPVNTPLILFHLVTPDPMLDHPNVEVAGAVGSALNGFRSSTKILSFGRFHHLSINELVTTLTLENAIAAPAIIGCKLQPRGRKNPMAKGMPRMLYTHAQMRFRLIVENILRDRWRAATTSSKSERIKTISAASIATVVPDERAIPTEAATRAGESLIPSPTFAKMDIVSRSHNT